MAHIASNYEINVALKKNPEDKYGEHWCKIDLPDGLEERAEKKLEMLRSIFGDHFSVTMTYWECHGEGKKEWNDIYG